MNVRRWLALALLCWGQSTPALEQATLANLLAAELSAQNMPGVRASVRFADGREVSVAVGYADLETKALLDATTPMPGGSTGKTFVAALTMLLAEEGVLSVDDHASRWLGDTAWFARLPNADAIRVRHLLSHSAGIADYPATVGFQLANAWRRVRRGSAYFSPEELIGFTLDTRPLFAAGQGFAYSDTGYLVLGRLLERAADDAYYALLSRKILLPHKLTNVQVVDVSNPPGVPNGYQDGGIFGLAGVLDKRGRMKLDPASEWTGGGLNTTPAMLTRFYSLLAAGKIVQPGTFRSMLAGGYRDSQSPSVFYGYGLFVDEDEDTIMHGGRWPGYRSRVVHYLATDLTIAVQTNRDGRVDLSGLIERIADLSGHEGN